MVKATTGPSYLANIPSLPDDLLAVPHEALSHAQRVREQLLLADITRQIRLARSLHEALYGPIAVEDGTMPHDL